MKCFERQAECVRKYLVELGKDLLRFAIVHGVALGAIIGFVCAVWTLHPNAQIETAGRPVSLEKGVKKHD